MYKVFLRHHRRAVDELPEENIIAKGRYRRLSGSAFLLCTIMVLAACASKPMNTAALDDPSLTTASIARTTEEEGIDNGDIKAIQTAFTAASDEPEKGNSLAWNNPENGNEGTVKVLDEFMNSQGQKCRKFETKADTFMGISIYDGETCEVRTGFWAIGWLKQRMAQ